MPRVIMGKIMPRVIKKKNGDWIERDFEGPNHYRKFEPEDINELKSAIKSEIEKLGTVRFEKTVDNRYKAVLRDPRKDPTIDEVVSSIMRMTRH